MDSQRFTMPIPDGGKCDLFLRIAPTGYVEPTSPNTKSTAELTSEARPSTKSVYSITSTATREQRTNRLAGNARPVAAIFTSAAPPPAAAAYAPLPTPPRSIKSTSATISTFTQDSNTFPEANVIHHYTQCEHTSPPATRPLNVQPTLLHSSPSPTGETPRSILLDRCYECDLEYRRQQETSVLRKYHQSSNALHLRLVAAREALQTAETDIQINEDGIDKIVAEIDDLVARREAEVKGFWKGFSARWGPGTVGVRQGPQGGRMDVKWERPEKK